VIRIGTDCLVKNIISFYLDQVPNALRNGKGHSLADNSDKSDSSRQIPIWLATDDASRNVKMCT